MTYYVYILTTKNNKLFYIGVTSELQGRVRQHKEGANSSFTSRYNINKLVYFEEYDFIEDAINREKQLKRWHREWKKNLIEQQNPEYKDLLM